MISRRRFFKTSAALSGVAAGFPAIAHSADILLEKTGQRPRRIIHMVADGMGMGMFTCGEHLSNHMRQRSLTWTRLYNHPAAHFGMMNMRSLNSLVTDSAAAASSWGSGARVFNGAVNQLPDGTKLKNLFELFKGQGWKRGFVTTTEVTHATPAGFAASLSSRNSGYDIAAQYLERRIDLMLGGGQKYFSAPPKSQKPDLLPAYQQAGYTVMKQAADLDPADLDKPWLGIFAESHLPFVIDQVGDARLRNRTPSLAVMTRRALDWLQRHDHFMLMIEGGRVDHSAHNSDAAAGLRELLAFDEAIDAVLAFQQQSPDTLVVITADHCTGGPTLNGMGYHYNDSIPLLKNVLHMRCSTPRILARLTRNSSVTLDNEEEDGGSMDSEETSKSTTTNKAASVEEIMRVIRETTGYSLSRKRAGLLVPFLEKKGEACFKPLNGAASQLGQILGNHLGINWTSPEHTADLVPILAIGPGAEHFRGFIQNVDVFSHYTRLAGIDFKNPQAKDVVSTSGRHPAALENTTEYLLT
jgi:alkaline phosphatase